MPFDTNTQTQTQDFARAVNSSGQFAVVTENNPRQDSGTSATSVSLAWGTLQTALVGLSVNQANLARLQDFIDRAPTQSYRGTP